MTEKMKHTKYFVLCKRPIILVYRHKFIVIECIYLNWMEIVGRLVNFFLESVLPENMKKRNFFTSYLKNIIWHSVILIRSIQKKNIIPIQLWSYSALTVPHIFKKSCFKYLIAEYLILLTKSWVLFAFYQDGAGRGLVDMIVKFLGIML